MLVEEGALSQQAAEEGEALAVLEFGEGVDDEGYVLREKRWGRKLSVWRTPSKQPRLVLIPKGMKSWRRLRRACASHRETLSAPPVRLEGAGPKHKPLGL